MSDKASPAPAPVEGAVPFWRAKTLAQMNAREWESLCDGCGRCCLVKLEDDDTGEVHYTDVGCRLLDAGSCRCRDYRRRQRKVADCVRLTPASVASLRWLPPTCAYRLLDEGRDLPSWHPLVSGDPATVHAAGVSVANRVSGHEDEFSLADLLERVVEWPTADIPGR